MRVASSGTIGHAKGAVVRRSAERVLLAWAVSAFACAVQDPGAPEGVVVERVEAGLAAARGGVESGDVLLSWSAGGGKGGELATPFDLRRIEIESSLREPVSFTLRRGEERLRVDVPVGEWGMEARPPLDAETREALGMGGEQLDESDVDRLADRGHAVVRSLAESGDRASATWIACRIGQLLAGADRWSEAHEAFDRAHEIAEDEEMLAASWALRAEAEERDRSAEHAVEAWQRAVELRRDGGGNLPLARDLLRYGRFLARRGEPARAREAIGEAHEIWRRIAPRSLGTAQALNGLGIAAAIRGRIELAEARLGEALALQERTAPGGFEMAGTLNNLGNLARRRGDFESAEDYYGRSLERFNAIVPGSVDLSRTLNNLGLLAKLRGDLVKAEDFYRRSLDIKREHVPHSLEYAFTLANLGSIALERGDRDSAEVRYREALGLFEELAPDSLSLATSLLNLGNIERARGNLDEAEELYRRGLELRRRRAPESLFVGNALLLLGHVAEERGRMAEARHLYEEAFELHSRAAPRGVETAESLFELGRLASLEGRYETAEAYLERSLDIRTRLSPDSTDVAETLHALGRLTRRRGDTLSASRYFERAMDALESQETKLGGSQEVKSGYGAQHGLIYKEHISLLVDEDRTEAAFRVLERYRARVLRGLLAGRDLLEDTLPPDLAQERQNVHREYAAVHAELSRLEAGSEDETRIDELLGRLRELKEERSRIAATVRASSPRLAAFEAPDILDLARTRQLLSPDELLLSYAVLADELVLFAVTSAAGLRVVELPLAEEELRGRVERFRNLILHSAKVSEARPALEELGTKLHGELLGPVREWVDTAERLLIVPDGPLHLLPFGALVREHGEPRYLLEDVSLRTVTSITLYAELLDTAPSVTSREVVVFGDADHPSHEELPGSRLEADAIADRFPDESRVFVGAQATEHQVKSLGSARYVHFSCHGVLDDRSPLDSYLVLSPPPNDGDLASGNGLLQAWEVFEQTRLEADLVTLSACESGLGKELGGEGLMGLTRAFQYAGARSIVASLWKVSDRSTAALMERFYESLASGLPKDAALRRAQLALIRGPVKLPEARPNGIVERLSSLLASLDDSPRNDRVEATHPFHWAAFQLVGDWR